MTSAQFEIIPPDRERHAQGIADLVALVFGGDDPIEWRDRSLRGLVGDRGYYRWADSRIGLLGGRVVTHVGVVGYTMRLGSGQVPIAGVAAVATAPFQRRRGLMRQTFAAAVEGFRPAGYAASILFGIDDFYHKFGYARAWSETSFSVSVSDLPPTPESLSIHTFSEPPWETVQDLYNTHNQGASGTAVRPRAGSVFLPLRNVETLVWETAGGRNAGYVIVKVRESDLEVLDHAGHPESVLAVVRRVAEEKYRERVSFAALSTASPLGRRLRRGTCRIQIRSRVCGGPMIRIVNLRACLEALRSDLESRLAASWAAGTDFDLSLSDGREEAVIRARAGQIGVTEPGTPAPDRVEAGDHLATLIIGGEAPEEILELPGVRCTGRGRRLAESLFPEQRPMLSRIDRF
ncbi:MAG: GNAT family N-acetyltransferase [Kiritimatiellaeota bacterium]|nr:GNAT family N-acetyltransferase [Kiritimatiellota bacterium]